MGLKASFFFVMSFAPLVLLSFESRLNAASGGVNGSVSPLRSEARFVCSSLKKFAMKLMSQIHRSCDKISTHFPALFSSC